MSEPLHRPASAPAAASAAGAFAFLLVRSATNRFLARLRRLKNPRYAIALVVGVAYFWFFIFRPRSGAPEASSLMAGGISAIAPLIMLMILIGVWLFGGDRSALAFSPAELAFLLPAPLTRRQVIGYKLASSQLPVALSSIIWVVLLRRGPFSLQSVLAAISFWLLFSTLGMHRLAAALVRASAGEHKGAGLRRSWLAFVIFAIVVGVLGKELFDAQPALHAAEGPEATLDVLMRTLRSGWTQYVLAPFHWMLGPTMARTPLEWLRALPAALGILALHFVWVFRSDSAFEEAAIEASAKRAVRLAQLRARRSAMPVAPAPKAAARTIRLAPTGWPATAIAWKNSLCFLRTVQVRTLILPAGFAIGAAFLMPHRGGTPWANVALMAAIVAVVLVIFGGRSLRNDLRSDMLHLAFLKTLPLRGRDVVLAEIVAAATPLTVIEVLMVAIAYGALAMDPEASPISGPIRLGVLLASPFVLAGLNFASFTLMNGTAVLYPGWMRLGTAVGGVEVMGTSLLATTGLLLGQALLLVVPALAAAAAYAVLRLHPAAAIVSAGGVAAALLAIECYALCVVIGRFFEKAEPSQTV